MGSFAEAGQRPEQLCLSPLVQPPDSSATPAALWRFTQGHSAGHAPGGSGRRHGFEL